MKRRNSALPVLILLLLFVVFLIRRWNEPKRKESFNRQPTTLRFSTLAKCQMQCGNVTKDEIEEIMQKGWILYHQSDRLDRPCPGYTLQGRSGAGNYLRIRFRQCRFETLVIDCNNLENTKDCSCTDTTQKGGL